MLHPVGRLPARVYWRRRLVFVGLPVLGIVLILWATLSGGGSGSSASNTSNTTSRTTATATPTTSPVSRDSVSIGVSTTSRTTTSAATSVSASVAGKGFCTTSDLSVVAGTAEKSFAVKSRPGLSMLVTNTSTSPCKIDAADKNVEWRIYSGDVRVWGSHDCAVEPGSKVVTLRASQPVTLTIIWSGLTSAPKCAGTRIAVQAGTYRLYAYLDGKRSAPRAFTIK